jgi:hypothetical protein
MVDFLLYAASLEASDATRSKMSDKRVSALQIGSRCDSDMHTVDERVQDGHGAVGDTGVGVDLLKNWSQQLANVWWIEGEIS